jgi:hypothetical protein
MRSLILRAFLFLGCTGVVIRDRLDRKETKLLHNVAVNRLGMTMTWSCSNVSRARSVAGIRGCSDGQFGNDVDA